MRKQTKLANREVTNGLTVFAKGDPAGFANILNFQT